MSQSRKGISLPDLSILFGPDPDGQETKNGASAEAARREVVAMEAIAYVPQPLKAERFETLRVALSAKDYVREGFVRFSAAQAALVLRECRYVRQTRDLRLGGQNQIKVLADIMRRNQWRSRDQMDFALLGGTLILLNGHHRLAAQSLCGAAIEWSVVIHPCDTDEDVEKLFYSFDTNVRIRSNATILSAANAADLMGVTATTAEALYRVAPLLAANFDFTRAALDPVVTRVVDRRIEIMKAVQAEALVWETAVKNAPKLVKKRLRTQGALAVALITLRHSRERALSFWSGVAENNGLFKGDPRHTYLAALMTENMGGSVQHTARQAVTAWNKWYVDKPLTVIKYREDTPLRILGTPVGR